MSMDYFRGILQIQTYLFRKYLRFASGNLTFVGLTESYGCEKENHQEI